MPEQRGFTLIELLIVVAIIGIVAAIATPHLLNATDRGRQSGTMGDMRAILTAIEHYAVDHSDYPVADNVKELAPLLEPDYISRMPRTDAWNHPFLYDGEARGYTLTSLGKDGTPQGTPPAGPTGSADADIIAADGTFLQWPAGRRK
jgi:general secretion pathway protein G